MWNRIKSNIDSSRPLFEGNEEQHLILAILIYFVAKDALKFFSEEQKPKVVYVLEKDKESNQPPYYLQPVKTEDGQTLYKLLLVK